MVIILALSYLLLSGVEIDEQVNTLPSDEAAIVEAVLRHAVSEQFPYLEQVVLSGSTESLNLADAVRTSAAIREDYGLRNTTPMPLANFEIDGRVQVDDIGQTNDAAKANASEERPWTFITSRPGVGGSAAVLRMDVARPDAEVPLKLVYYLERSGDQWRVKDSHTVLRP